MAKKSLPFNLLTLAAITATLVITVLITQNNINFSADAARRRANLNKQETLQLKAGWNFVSFTIDPDGTSVDFCQMLPEELDVIIWKYDEGYKGHVCVPNNYPGTYDDEFELVGYEGYWMYVAEDYALTVKGRPVKNVPLLDGWSMVGFPVKRNTMASDYCGPLRGTGMSIVEINEWDDATNGWNQMNCADPEANDFALTENAGYFVKSEQSTRPGSQRNNRRPANHPRR